jgi:hypothetical protein
MVLIALVAVLCFGGVMLLRRADFQRRADYHARAVEKIRDFSIERARLPSVEEYHQSMAKKYEWAARHPWAEVEPDPREP